VGLFALVRKAQHENTAAELSTQSGGLREHVARTRGREPAPDAWRSIDDGCNGPDAAGEAGDELALTDLLNGHGHGSSSTSKASLDEEAVVQWQDTDLTGTNGGVQVSEQPRSVGRELPWASTLPPASSADRQAGGVAQSTATASSRGEKIGEEMSTPLPTHGHTLEASGGSRRGDTERPVKQPVYIPPRPTSLEAAGLSQAFVTDSVLRTLYLLHEATGHEIATRLALHFGSTVAPILEGLRREQAVEVKGQRGLGDGGYVYVLTEKGRTRAEEARRRTQYEGPAPVPLETYVASVLAQRQRQQEITPADVQAAFGDLVLSTELLDDVGAAVTSSTSLFLFGPPGNGKTSIAERIVRLLGDPVYVPYAVEVDGQVIKLFDPAIHQQVAEPASHTTGRDQRFVYIRRPLVVAGGELALSSLELLYNETGRYYEAPPQMKANLGMFLIDDFGRQPMRPHELLNRWIVPLEKRVDLLTLRSGKKFEVPFDELIVFSTNLDPQELVDEAFLRRIKFKIYVGDPDEAQFQEIFLRNCRCYGVTWDDTAFQYLLERHYRAEGRPLRACHPRDLLEQLAARARYRRCAPRLDIDLLDRVCQTYFVVHGRAHYVR
jgi:hypothetical protein